MEIYNNKLIAYNLGDFIFNRETKDTGILSVTLNKKEIYLINLYHVNKIIIKHLF